MGMTSKCLHDGYRNCCFVTCLTAVCYVSVTAPVVLLQELFICWVLHDCYGADAMLQVLFNCVCYVIVTVSCCFVT